MPKETESRRNPGEFAIVGHKPGAARERRSTRPGRRVVEMPKEPESSMPARSERSRCQRKPSAAGIQPAIVVPCGFL
jgi:hypothetical protein